MLVKNKFKIHILQYFKCRNSYTFDDPIKHKKSYTVKHLLCKMSYTFNDKIKL